MTDTHILYPPETLGAEDDDGTMPENVSTLAEAVVGHRIESVEKLGYRTTIVLDNKRRVVLADSADCCAYTELDTFLLYPERIDHVITGVGTTDGYQTWHIYADLGDILELTVGWSCGNPFYYGYGFEIAVEEARDD